jgi:cytoskeletal protein CcmA (bactofilin family)
MICYACGAEFTVAGRMGTIVCSKCRTVLNQADVPWGENGEAAVKTVGVLTILPGATVREGHLLVARDVVLEGRVEGGRLRALRRLEIRAGAVYAEAFVETRDLLVGPGAHLALGQERSFRDVDVAGELHANLRATGALILREGAYFQGDVYAARLIVEEGAGLVGEVRVGA